MRDLETKFLIGILIVISIALAVVALPFLGAVLWAVVAAILFEPLNQRFLRAMNDRRTLAALLSLLTIVAAVILPAMILAAFLLQEGLRLYTEFQTGGVDFARYFERFQASLPHWASRLLDRFGLTDIDKVGASVTAGIASSFQTLAGRALNIGQSAFGFLIALGVMLYLTFFLLRDGQTLSAGIGRAVPLRPEHRNLFATKFVAIVRATIKGSAAVAVMQGLIGGLTFWALGLPAPLLWGVAMGFLSLLPVVGTGLVWVPVALYLLATGSIGHGLALIFCGLFVIGMVDNIIRPILIGRDVQMPDYVVLISTLGGLEVFGFNGFVIGPMIATLFIAAWQVFAVERKNAARE